MSSSGNRESKESSFIIYGDVSILIHLFVSIAINPTAVGKSVSFGVVVQVYLGLASSSGSCIFPRRRFTAEPENNGLIIQVHDPGRPGAIDAMGDIRHWTLR